MHIESLPYHSVMADLRQLRAFVAVADAGTFTDAAIDLGVSQAAVSRTVAALERDLGVSLLHRTPRGADPTPLGHELLPQARRVLAEMEAFADLAHTQRRVLRLGYAWAAVGRHTPTLLREWAARHPETELRLVRHVSATAGLAEGLCDVAIVRVDVDPTRFDAVVVGLERSLVVFRDDDPWLKRRSVTMAEIAERTVLVDSRTGTTRAELWPSDAQPQVRAIHDVDGWLDAIAAGQGVGTTSEATIAHHQRAGIAHRRIGDGPCIPVRLAWRRDAPPPAAAVLAELLGELYDR